MAIDDAREKEKRIVILIKKWKNIVQSKRFEKQQK